MGPGTAQESDDARPLFPPEQPTTTSPAVPTASTKRWHLARFRFALAAQARTARRGAVAWQPFLPFFFGPARATGGRAPFCFARTVLVLSTRRTARRTRRASGPAGPSSGTTETRVPNFSSASASTVGLRAAPPGRSESEPCGAGRKRGVDGGGRGMLKFPDLDVPEFEDPRKPLL